MKATTFYELLAGSESPLDTYPPDACSCLYGYLDEAGTRICPECNGTWKRPQPEINCSRCGRPLTDPERQADGMGMWCRNHQPHRRRLQFLGVDPDGASRFSIYSRSRGGTDVQHEVRVHFENGEFHCTCEHHKFTGKTCEHIKRACAWERRRRKKGSSE